MTEFAIERFRYTWKGIWTPGENYKRDDAVSVNGKSYVCLITHTASQVFSNDLNAILPGSVPPQPQPRWVLMTQGRSFRGNWGTGIEYNLGEIAYYKGSVWVCETAHVSSVFSSDRENWGFLAKHIEFLGDWESSTDYAEGSLAKYNGVVYRCVIAHTSSGLLENDQEKWRVFHDGIEYRGAWQPNQEFRANDLVKYGASVFRCIETHTSQATSTQTDPDTGQSVTVIGFDSDKFQIEFPGFQFESEWDPSTQYQAGDIVRYGGVLWYALRPNIDSDPFQLPDDSTIDWIELSASYNFRGEWGLEREYKKGDVVQRGGQLFLALRDVGRNDGAGSVADYLDPDWWELLIPGSKFSDEWDAGKLYSVGDVVYYLGTAYRCNFEHISDNTNFPGDNGNIYDYWDIVIQAGQPGGLQEENDLLSYGLNRTIVGDGSTEGPIRVPIGETEQILSVSDELEVFWRDRENDSDKVWVAEFGVDSRDDDPERGLVPHKPFRTIRFAAEYIEDTFDPLTLVTIRVATGEFTEIAPVTVPAGCAIFGDELRSTTVRPNRALPEYQNDFQYVQDYLNYITTFILPVLRNEEVEPSQLNDEPQKLNTATTNIDGVNAILSLVNDFLNFVDAELNGAGTKPSVSGSNDLNADDNLQNAAQALLQNRQFIETELWAHIQEKYERDFDRKRVRNDVFALIRGIARDLKYSGNYATLLAAQRYVNAVQGSLDKDLFWVRDTTGIRNLTTKGLEGGIEAPTAEDRYQRATGGSYVALDPGWGPDDERTWIENRSPYIQGVTTIGTGCVGKRIDGRLHNGGNRSMVSNDFTQVLSDGVGVWVTDGGRTELVSVFTYYNTVGYLAERGGIIRATNGNNSYGRFGSVADGRDPTETPQDVTVFNRNNEAQVNDAFAGGDTDEILVFEYSNAGEQYTQADAIIEGAGDFADVEYSDFRDGALFEARIINTKGSGRPGGSGYLVRQGFAQETLDASSTIFLASSDENAEDVLYEGARIIIIAGTGTGQYGYIDSYNPPNKQATIRRESDGELGWDHVIPGTPIEPALDTTAQYRIEPRIETNHPGFSSQTGALPQTTGDLRGFRFGTTTAIFENVQIGQGSGVVNGIPAVQAEFTVTRKGRNYSLAITESGAGYSVGDQFIIAGSELDGESPANDIELTVTEVTEDSTNSIVDFSVRGEGRGGRFVAVDDTTAYYSDDGDIWNTVPLPFQGNSYSDLAAGDSQFIAIAQGENRIARSLDGETWTTETLPSTENWSAVTYGADKWVIVSDNSDFVLYSDDGETWSETQIPEDTVSDSTGDSSVSSYVDVVYGKGKFVAVSTSDRATATSQDGVTWTRNNESLVDRGSDYSYDIVGIEYGDNRYIVISRDGVLLYSFDGISWLEGTALPLTGSEEVIDLRYSQGVFFAVYGEPGTFFDTVATTEDGVIWLDRTLSAADGWQFAEYGYVGNSHKWVVLPSQSFVTQTVFTGKQAKLRADVFQGFFQSVKIWDPGSGYTPENTVELTITDATFTVAVETESRLGDGVLPQPDFINRGNGYRTSTSTIEITGNGFADIIPEDDTLVLAGVSTLPDIGAQIRIDGIFDENADDPEERLLFSAAGVTDLGDDRSGNNTRLIEVQISPDLENEYNLEHGTPATINIRYSQVRVTNHDFLDIGTGNFEQTNYPEIYAGGAFFTASPEQEVLEESGGRVFFVSTDQDGNFKAGDLFAVEQATGVITISADFFDFTGLSELALGGIRLGGSGTIVREFSTDPSFAADSDNVVATQQAIAEFLESRLSVGGQEIKKKHLQTGRVQVGTTENRIDNLAGEYVRITTDADFTGVDEFGNPSAVGGTWISQQICLGTDKNDTMQ